MAEPSYAGAKKSVRQTGKQQFENRNQIILTL